MITEWFVLMTLIVAKATTVGSVDHKVGDVIDTSFLGAALTEEACEEAGSVLGHDLRKIGDVLIIHPSCVEVPVETVRKIAEDQEWKETK